MTDLQKLAQIKDSKHLKKRFVKLDSIWSSESALRTYATILSLEKLENIEKLLQKQKRAQRKHSLSNWQLFCADGLKKGKTLKELSSLYWKEWQTNQRWPTTLADITTSVSKVESEKS